MNNFFSLLFKGSFVTSLQRCLNNKKNIGEPFLPGICTGAVQVPTYMELGADSGERLSPVAGHSCLIVSCQFAEHSPGIFWFVMH